MSEDQRRKLIEARRIVEAVLRGEKPILEAAPLLSSALVDSKFATTEPYLLFLGVSSETDHLPFGAVRQHWSPESLKQKDIEAAIYEATIREPFLSACRQIAKLLPQE